MSLDYQQVREQIKELGKTAPERVRQLQIKRATAMEALNEYSDKIELLNEKISMALDSNANLRCAIPGNESLNHRKSLPIRPEFMTIIAADGSQINPDRHSFTDYCLVNIGAILLHHGKTDPPTITVRSQLLYGSQMYTETGRLTERLVALRRDLYERQLLSELAQDATLPLITLTDGPLELWVGREADLDSAIYDQTFKEYLEALNQLHKSGAVTAGYIDQPQGDLLVRLLEIALLPLDDLKNAGRHAHRAMLGITDRDLFREILGPGERSAIFGIQSRNAGKYTNHMALHFFYLNVEIHAEQKAYPVRVEIPAWVALQPESIDQIHAILVQQCQILGTRIYPYLLHRSHEVAVVSLDEKEQVERMIALELQKRGIMPGEVSQKQATKDLVGRTRM